MAQAIQCKKDGRPSFGCYLGPESLEDGPGNIRISCTELAKTCESDILAEWYWKIVLCGIHFEGLEDGVV